jgi:Exonuclease III
MNNLNGPPGRRQERHQNEQNRHSGIYGDHIKQKNGGMIRILFQNPQGLGRIGQVGQEQSLKLSKLKDFLIKHKFDVVGLSEVNKDWRLVPHKETLWATTEGWFEYRRLSTCINQKVRPQSQIQYGGTALMAINKCAYSIIKIEPDHRQLGRWTSILFRGKNQHLCRIICAYCPCKSTGPTSTYALQVVGLAQDTIVDCPRKQFWTDLKAYIGTCQEQNENVIIMGDWNSSYPEVVQWMNQFDLVDIIQTRHSHTRPPPTCKRSTTYPLDAIFAPSTFRCWRGGYLAYEKLESDHRGIWWDIPIEFILGC